MNAAQLARLRFIDLLLDHHGYINRSIIEDFFGVSTPQASLDLREYEANAPGNMFYDRTQRAYRRSPTTYQRRFP